MGDIEWLMSLQKKLAQSKEQKAKEEGKLEEQLERLHKEYKCKTIKEAENKIKEMEDKCTNLDEEFDKGINKLKEAYDGW